MKTIKIISFLFLFEFFSPLLLKEQTNSIKDDIVNFNMSKMFQRAYQLALNHLITNVVDINTETHMRNHFLTKKSIVSI